MDTSASKSSIGSFIITEKAPTRAFSYIGSVERHKDHKGLGEGSFPSLDVCKSRGFQDKLYDLDKSWENNLVFYGINSIRDEEDRPLLLENRVREILRYAE